MKSTCLNFTKFFNFTEKAGYTGKIKIGMDVAASEFHKDGKYDLDFKNPESKPEDWISSEQLCEMYKGFVQKYPVVCSLYCRFSYRPGLATLFFSFQIISGQH